MPLNPPVSKSKALEAQIGLPQHQGITVGGFKNPAKRTAFGDLSNTSSYPNAAHSVSVNGLGKPNVSATLTSSKMIPYKDDNKENTAKSGAHKDAFLRPAQRPSNNQKLLTSQSNFASQADYRIQPANKQNGTRKATLVYIDEQQQHQQQKPQTLSRQYRSQPQLKLTEPPQLRRSQSKHVIQSVNSTDMGEACDASHDTTMEEPSKEKQAALPMWMAVPGPNGPPTNAEMDPLQPTSVNGLLPSLSSGPYLPEHEEYWDEDDDEEFDDQGYTTANSCRSYGDNTTIGATALIAPKKTSKVQKELERARLFVETNRPREDIEEEDWDVSMVAEYGEEIFEYMRELEVSTMVSNAASI